MILGLLLHTVRFQEPTVFPDGWLQRQGFRRLDRETRNPSAYVHDGAQLQVTMSVWPRDHRVAKEFEDNDALFGTLAVSLSSFRVGLKNGMPLGTDVRLSTSTGRGLHMAFRTEWIYAYAHVYWIGEYPPPMQFRDKGEALLEGLARQTLARVEARRLTLPARRTLGETTVSTDGTPEVDLVDLSDWAKVRGWALQKDDTMATLTKGERKLRLPLGALAVEVDGKWKDLPEVVMLKDGKWWVPLDALEAAAQ